MSREPRSRWHATPPPCAQVCWEREEDVRARFLGAWSYTLSIYHCGHYQDRASGVWKWAEQRKLPGVTK